MKRNAVLHGSGHAGHARADAAARPAAHHAVPRRGGWRQAAPRVSTFVVEHLLLLPIGALAALVWANTAPESYFRTSYTIQFAVNDVAMAFFFGLITKEIVEATASGGVLHPWRRAAVPMAAAVGAVVVPALLCVVFARALGEPLLGSSWIASSAVDLALGYAVVRLVFGRAHPAIPFFLLLAIAANALGIAVLTILYPVREAHPFAATGLLAAAVLSALWLRRTRVQSFWPYVLGAGTLAWLAFFAAGSHTALALVPVVALMPHARHDPGFFVQPSPALHDPANRFERWWTYPVQIVLFFFGLVNAGVIVHALDEGTFALPLAVLIGRPVGILASIGLALLAGLHLPARVDWRVLVVLGLTSSVGFTVALFFASAIYGPGGLLAETRMGVLLTLLIVPLTFGVARALRVGRYGQES